MSYAKWETRENMFQRVIQINEGSIIEKGGIPIMYDDNNLYLNNEESHSLIIGTTGSGKTQSTILPLMKLSMLAGESIVINDVNGDIYAGTWESGQKNGQGEMTFANGDVYKGVFSYGMITGQGEMTYANGDRYVGEFVNGKRHGQGTCYYKDGTEFTGTWENDAPVQ